MQTIEHKASPELADALRTVAINSAYGASNALSKWFKRGVRLTSEGFQSVPLSAVAECAGPADSEVAAIHMNLEGDVDGDLLLIFPEKVGLQLVDIMIGAPAGTSVEFGELEASCLQETGNIVGSAITNGLASWLQMDVKPGTPTFIHDLAAAVIQPMLVEQAATSDDALVSKTEFVIDKQHLDWAFLLLPSEKGLALLQKACVSDDVRRHALQTIAINGAFNASRAMSKWIRKGVRLHTEGFERKPFRDVGQTHGDDEPIVALHMALHEQLHGHTLMTMNQRSAFELVELLMGLAPGSVTELDELATSALQETGNVICSAFVNSWAKWLEITTEPGPPNITVDLPGAIFESLLAEQAMAGDDVFMARTEFSIDDRWLEWQFYLLPSPTSLRLIEASCC